MKNFVKYAKYYDLFYRDKNYKKEADYVDSLIRRYCGKRNQTLLDIGCGTGGHAIWFAKKGYRVVGIDRSPEMISIAKERFPEENRIEFGVQDVSSLSLKKKFNIAVALFHVMGYLTANKVFVESLKNIYKQLKKEGLFIFDFWYGPAVLTQVPGKRSKTITDKNINIRRMSVPKIDFNGNTVNINYKIAALNKKSGLIETVNEAHKMRYFFLPELDLMLRNAGFKIVKSYKWLSLKESLTPKSWSAVIIAKRE